MSKHRHSTHLSLLVGFLMMAASAAAGQTTVGAGQSTAGAGQSTAGADQPTAAGGIVVVSARGIAELVPPEAVRPEPVELQAGAETGVDGLAEELALAGYAMP